jgi:hypothetical protein
MLTFALVIAGCGGGDDGGGGGGTHPLKETVVVDHADVTTEGNPKTKLAVTPQAVRKGTQAELEEGGFNLDPDEKTATPYYVDVRFENRGTKDIKNSLTVSLENADGGSISPTTVIDLGGAPFKPCPQAKSGTLKATATIDICKLFLVPEGSTPEKVSFLPYDPAKETEFVVWSAG